MLRYIARNCNKRWPVNSNSDSAKSESMLKLSEYLIGKNFSKIY